MAISRFSKSHDIITAIMKELITITIAITVPLEVVDYDYSVHASMLKS